jgi:hypothetical protein
MIAADLLRSATFFSSHFFVIEYCDSEVYTYFISERERYMLTKIRMILGIIVIFLAGFGLLTKNFVAQPFMMVALGTFVLVGGIKEHKNGQKRRAMVSFLLSIFVFTVFIQNIIN